MRVVIVGAGRMGCGYLAPLFLDAGHSDVALGCRTMLAAKRVANAGGWRIRVTGEPGYRREVSGAAPLACGTADFDDAVASADLVVTSVGVSNVRELGATLAPGLARRRGRGVDIWSVENAASAGHLRGAIERAAASSRLELPRFGVAGAVASTIIGRGSWHKADYPEFVGDAYRTLSVDDTRLTGGLPLLPGVTGCGDYPARLREKIYGFSAGHALTAYLGWLRGHRTVAAAVTDPFIWPLVAGALLEARRATLAGYPLLVPDDTVDVERDVHTPVRTILGRFADAELADPVTRVGREPLRKLGPRDRLMGPVRLLRQFGGSGLRPPAHFALGVAAALLFGFGDDDLLAREPQARRLRSLLRVHGVDQVLSMVCGLSATDPFTSAVADRYHRFVFLDDGVRLPPAFPGAPMGVA